MVQCNCWCNVPCFHSRLHCTLTSRLVEAAGGEVSAELGSLPIAHKTKGCAGLE